MAFSSIALFIAIIWQMIVETLQKLRHCKDFHIIELPY